MARPAKVGRELEAEADVEAALLELLEATTDLEILQAEQAKAVAAASAQFEARINARLAVKRSVEAALQAYYYSHLQEIEAGGKKFEQFVAGRIGRRDNPPSLGPLNRKWSWKAIRSAVQTLWGDKYLLPAKERDLDKDALKTVAEAELRQVGLKVDADETFYIELARPETKE